MNGIHTMNNQNNESVDNENNLKSQSHTNIINNINQQVLLFKIYFIISSLNQLRWNKGNRPTI